MSLIEIRGFDSAESTRVVMAMMQQFQWSTDDGKALYVTTRSIEGTKTRLAYFGVAVERVLVAFAPEAFDVKEVVTRFCRRKNSQLIVIDSFDEVKHGPMGLTRARTRFHEWLTDKSRWGPRVLTKATIAAMPRTQIVLTRQMP